MTIITSVPPPDRGGLGGKASAQDRGGLGGSSPRGKQSAVPGPLRFIGRALRTLWSNGKARTGLIKHVRTR